MHSPHLPARSRFGEGKGGHGDHGEYTEMNSLWLSVRLVPTVVKPVAVSIDRA